MRLELATRRSQHRSHPRQGGWQLPELAVDGSLLPGITRDCVIQLAGDLGIPVRETAVPREMLYMSDELFFTGTAAEVTPIRSVDRIPVGDAKVGPITRVLQERLLGVAHGRLPDTRGWRTPVEARAGAPHPVIMVRAEIQETSRG